MDKLTTKHISVFEYLDYRLYLDALYKSIKESKIRYSYLQFSEDLGFSKTNVIHLIIKGKRPLSLKAAEKICKNVNISSKDKNYFLKLVEYQNTRKPENRENLFKHLIKLKSEILKSPEIQSQLEFFSEWYHIIIYQMTFLKFR